MKTSFITFSRTYVIFLIMAISLKYDQSFLLNRQRCIIVKRSGHLFQIACMVLIKPVFNFACIPQAFIFKCVGILFINLGITNMIGSPTEIFDSFFFCSLLVVRYGLYVNSCIIYIKVKIEDVLIFFITRLFTSSCNGLIQKYILSQETWFLLECVERFLFNCGSVYKLAYICGYENNSTSYIAKTDTCIEYLQNTRTKVILG